MRKIRDPKSEICQPGFEVFHEDFLKSRKEELILLQVALAKKDFKTIIYHAHQWKGFSGPYGFQQLESAAINLEKFAKNSDLAECSKLLKEIEEYLG